MPAFKPALVYFSSLEALEAIFTAKPEQLSAGRENQILKFLLGKHGNVLQEDEAHRQQNNADAQQLPRANRL